MAKLSLLATLEGHEERAWFVAWSPDGKLLASCSSDKTVRIWGRKAGGGDSQWLCVAVIEEGASRTVRSCAWSPCGKFLAVVSFDGTTSVWEKVAKGVTLSFELLASLEGHENEVKSVAWSTDGAHVATCGRDKSVWIWEAMDDGDYECVTVLHGHTQDVKMVAWHPSEPMLFSASYDNTIKIWAEDGDDWYCAETLEGHTSSVWSIALEGGGERLASASDDCTVLIWKRFEDAQPSGGRWRRVCKLAGYHARTVYSVAWHAREPLLATGAGDDAIRIFRESEGSSARSDAPSFDLEVTVASAHAGDVNCVAWAVLAAAAAAQRVLLASAGDDCLVKVWQYDAS
eukprot:TRINITY_DN13365_c0_g1_i2.p1 TRINITY_DN13365_c0_g1~~TRINITY_DN13365_c0_g1_i2.p1  ORF type:complete len:344 (-),score=83.48 TRINITY_DN13365_c0_g1_i2:45-1076(-)